MTEDSINTKKNPSIFAVTIGVILFFLGLLAWLALVPVTFLSGFHSETSDPTTRELLFYALAAHFVLAGSGVAIITSNLTLERRVSRVMMWVFAISLAIGFAHYFWLGTLPNGIEIPDRVGPSPNRP